MLVSFAVGRRPSGERIIAEFNLRLRYTMEPFNFDPRAFTTNINLGEIGKRFTEIDNANVVDLIGTESVMVEGRLPSIIDGRLYIYPTGDRLFWTFRRQGTEERVAPRLSQQLRAARPEIVGAVRLRLPELKHDMREYVRAFAMRRATAMKTNAEIILRYLSEL